MKKIITALVITALLATTEAGLSQPESILAVNIKKSAKISSEGVKKINSPYINARAKRNFYKAFQNVSNETWFLVPGGYIANFLDDGVDYRVIFNAEGKQEYTQLIYSEDKLPFEIRDMVRSQYYDNDIRYCSEYRLRDRKIYAIKMTSNNFPETTMLKIENGEMTEIPWQ